VTERSSCGLLVWSSLFPSAAQPQAGIFIQERMFRVARRLPIAVIAPQPWFPLQSLIRIFRPAFRPPLPIHEQRSGIEIHRPYYFSFPGFLKRLDGRLMAYGSLGTARRLCSRFRLGIIDAHFAYPDGYAAVLVAKRLGLPCTITLRGSEARQVDHGALRSRIMEALSRADRVFAVSESLRRLAVSLGVPESRVKTVPNGVDAERFQPKSRLQARTRLGLAVDANVLITIGGLVERKGFHRVIACIPMLIKAYPKLHYLIVGGPGPEGDFGAVLRNQVNSLGLNGHVTFLGPLDPDGVSEALSAADVFVLATRNEGWANVLLEAMACGLPVVATDVGGNAEVVRTRDLGTLVPFGDGTALEAALEDALRRQWNRDSIRAFAASNRWQDRVDTLIQEFMALNTSLSQARGDLQQA
jgi:teichuronic acid biosynthesis glycosyltransferase TuaC